jgi:hypothetical protein
MKYKIALSDKNDVSLIPKEIQNETFPLLDFANEELEKFYKGKYKFSITDKEVNIKKLKIDVSKKRRILEKTLEFNSKLSKIQRKFEKYLQEENNNEIL